MSYTCVDCGSAYDTRSKSRIQCPGCHAMAVEARKQKIMGSCTYCGSWRQMTRDHVVPKSQGGTYIVPVCHQCNCSKANMSLQEWLLTLPGDAPQHHFVTFFICWAKNNMLI